MSGDASVSILRTLPVRRWVRRLVGGELWLEGTLPAPLALPSGAAVAAGPVTLELGFRGGEAPAVTEVSLAHGGGTVAPGSLGGPDLEALLDALHDVAISVTVRPDGEVVLELGGGLVATLDAAESITVRTRAEGPPTAPRLCSPLALEVEGPGIQVGHSRIKSLSRMARAVVSALTVQPDGTVRLDGGARGVLDLAMTRGLRKLSERLTVLVRESPRFERVRVFLQVS